MKLTHVAWAAMIAGAQLSTCSVLAQQTDTSDVIQKLQKKVEELEQKVKALESNGSSAAQTNGASAIQRLDAVDQKLKVLERQREVDKDSAAETAKSLPAVSLGLNGLVVRSADSNFLMNVHGYVQADGRFYLNDHN